MFFFYQKWLKKAQKVQKNNANNKDSSFLKATVVSPDEETRKAIENVAESNSTKILFFDGNKTIDEQIRDLVNKMIDNFGKFYKYQFKASNQTIQYYSTASLSWPSRKKIN